MIPSKELGTLDAEGMGGLRDVLRSYRGGAKPHWEASADSRSRREGGEDYEFLRVLSGDVGGSR